MDNQKYIEELLNSIRGDNFKKIVNTLEDGYRGMYVILKFVRDNMRETVAGDISKNLNISTARVAVCLNSLEKKGYIVKSKSKTDGRVTVVEITDLGKSVLAKREGEIKELIQLLFSNLSEEEVVQLINIIKKIKGSN